MPCLRAAALALAVLAPTALFAQSNNCADRARVVKSLQKSYGESFAGGGMQNAQQIIEIWYWA